MFAFRFASSSAKLLTTARLAAAIDGLRLGAGTGIDDPVRAFFGFVAVEDEVSSVSGFVGFVDSSVVSVALRFLDFLVDFSIARRAIISSHIRSSVSASGFIILTSFFLSYFVEHCGQISKSSLSPSLSVAGGVDEDAPLSAFNPA